MEVDSLDILVKQHCGQTFQSTWSRHHMVLDAFFGLKTTTMFSAASKGLLVIRPSHRTDLICSSLVENPAWDFLSSMMFQLISDLKRISSQVNCLEPQQEPILVWPAAFMRIMNEVPHLPRPLKNFDSERIKKLMQLASALLDTNPVESTQRTVQYFMKISNTGAVPDPVPALRWVTQRVPH